MLRKLLPLLLLLPLSALGAEVNVTWVHPTQYSDNSALPLEAIRDTTVQYGTCTTATTPTFGTLTRETIVPGPARTVLFSAVAPATYCFRARTTDAQARVSNWSAVVKKAVVDIKPKAPTTLTVTL